VKAKVSPAGTADLLQSIRAVSIWLSTRDQSSVSHDAFFGLWMYRVVDLLKEIMPNLVMHPFGWTGLNELHGFGYCHCGRQRDQQVGMGRACHRPPVLSYRWAWRFRPCMPNLGWTLSLMNGRRTLVAKTQWNSRLVWDIGQVFYSAVPGGTSISSFVSRHLLRCVPGYFQSRLRRSEHGSFKHGMS